MPFFDQLGKKLTDAGQGVVQQTKNLADVTRLNSAISNSEKQIAQLYAVIGQAYYEAHKNDPNAESPEQIQAINALSAEIEQNQEAIRVIKGITQCPNCGKDVPLGSAFCAVCGTKLPEAAPAPAPAPEGKVCPNCGAAVAEGNLFCNRCGTRVAEETDDTNGTDAP
ncbi:MAG: zinc ribbon domain-containing protein [Acutalibacter sp.]|nr:zinc ribbon domain-containing protein [Acutalibacter sp.]